MSGEYNKYVKSIDGKMKEEHRIIMENHLGRSLNSDEVIHHINGNHLDNRIENLMLTTHQEHAKMYHASKYKKKEDKCIKKNLSLYKGTIELGKQLIEKYPNIDNFSQLVTYLILKECGKY